MIRATLVRVSSEEEAKAVQAEIEAAGPPKVFHRTFKPAKQPCCLVLPDREPVPVVFESSKVTLPFVVHPIKGQTYGYVYNEDPTREDQARIAQPPEGEKPQAMSSSEVSRMADGSLVLGFPDAVLPTYRVIAEAGSLAPAPIPADE